MSRKYALKSKLSRPQRAKPRDTQLPPDEIAVAEPPPSRGTPRPTSLLSLAVDRLRTAGTASCKDLVAYALQCGWTTNGRTPEATLNAALHREAKKPGARVKKAERGMWGAA